MKKISRFRFLNLILLVLLISGCKSKTVSKPVNIQKPLSVSTTQIQPKTTAVTATQGTTQQNEFTYTYNPAGKPDPFEPFDISKIKPSAQLTPLQQFSLDQLILKGIIWGVSDAKAIIQDPTGKTYIVGKGAKIGKNNGEIVRILDDRVIILENYTDVFTGKIKTNEVTMQLKKTSQ
ncbi:MAG: pilus assembly protein PilP [Deltaproteobacteria bacterium]|nr:pilus assembly protein PilP [Deltaproteobacteria bacterium]MCL5792818.1 pilus assembly protein PilP [Deltaproteobacteria bacterium]